MLQDVYRTATSKAVRRTLVYGVLLAVASAVLYGVAVVGYLGFYHDYVPHRVRTAPLYLQYGQASALSGLAHARQPQHPFAIADLRGLSLKTDQAYDVSVSLRLPRSPANQAAGNFMLELALVTAGVSSSSLSLSTSPDTITMAARLPPASPRDFLAADGRRVVYAAARPALLAYTDPFVAAAGRLVFLPYHLLAPAAAPETARLVVAMAESLSFDSADALPAALYVELRATAAGDAAAGHHQLQTYGVDVVFAARLRGLRWFMYHHAIASFVVLTAAFWLVEVLFMAGACLLLGTFLSGGVDGDADADGNGNGSDHHGRPLPPAKTDEVGVAVKKEEGEAGRRLGRSLLASIPARPVGSGGGDNKTNGDDQTDDEEGDSGHEEGDSRQEASLQRQGAAAAATHGRPTAITTGSSAVAAEATTESSLRQRQQQQQIPA